MTEIAFHASQKPGPIWKDTGTSSRQSDTLLIAAPTGVISDAVAFAIAREFSWLRVQIVNSMDPQPHLKLGTLRLALIDIAWAAHLETWLTNLQQQQTMPRIAFITNDETALDAIPSAVLDWEGVRGVVAVNVGLDVLLSSLHILLKGGRHFSVAPLTQTTRAAANAPAEERETAEANPVTDIVTSPGLARLTRREAEILDHIALGSQNKVIAAALGLSEHTVKIHIHNLITKLRVHNRTEAAALYLRKVGTPRPPATRFA
jgi:DNA-binding NarL/FixJ family response regulator